MRHNDGARVVLSGASQFKTIDDKISSYREWANGIAGLVQLGVPAELIARPAQRESERILDGADPEVHRLP